MVRIAIVDDETQAVETLRGMLLRYSEAHQVQFEIETFKNAIIFLTNYQPVYDIVFCDIQMPHMDGLEAAEQLRKLDSETMLIFVTNMAQYAVHGYQVRAFDFLVKPLNEDAFALKLRRMLEQLSQRTEHKLLISSGGAQLCLSARDIYYIEIYNHQLLYRTAAGEFPVYGTLSSVQKDLEGQGFALCNNCYLVNLRHVQKVYKHTVTVHGTELPIRSYEQAQATVFDLTGLLAEQANLNSEMQIVSQMMEDCIRQNASVAQDQAEYQKRFDALSSRFDAAKAKHEEVTQQISDKQSRKAEMEDALKLLKKQDCEITTFRDGLWTGLLDYVTVYADGRMTFTFKIGQPIDA